MKIKKGLSLLLIFIMIFTLTACNTMKIVEGKELPTIQSKKHLKELLKEHMKYTDYRDGSVPMDTIFTTNNLKTDSMTLDAGSVMEESTNFSDTNVQVDGVDEGDIIKTDGKYIYMINNSKMFISEVYPVENMEIVSEIGFEQNFRPIDIYINNDKLIVIGSKNHNFYRPKTGLQKIEMIDRIINPYPRYIYTTKVIVYDKSNIEDVKISKQFEIQGNYLSSRLTKDNLYIITNLHAYYDYGDIVIPLFSEDSRDFQEIDLTTIRYFPNIYTPEFMTVSTLNLEKNKVEIDTYLGAGDNIYASQEHLYIVDTQYRETIRNNQVVYNDVSEIHKFKLEEGKTEYILSNSVEGRVLNQFSMDEYNGYFRVATTTGSTWGTGENVSKNHVFVLDEDLKKVGSVKDIAPTERIYSARFMGNKVYLVTFRDTDPLYVIDLSKPEKPEILGMLKIPGYSNYLHPYDEKHIIGFGKEVHETKEGRFLDGGVKIALFDVSDVNNPIEKFKVEIGDRGTNSPLLYNHKALLFDKDRNLFALPITVYEKTDVGTNFIFQGAYIYNLDLEDGFILKGEITHLDNEDHKKVGTYYHSGDKSIHRIIRIEDILYTFSNKELRANNLDDFKELNKVNLK